MDSPAALYQNLAYVAKSHSAMLLSGWISVNLTDGTTLHQPSLGLASELTQLRADVSCGNVLRNGYYHDEKGFGVNG